MSIDEKPVSRCAFLVPELGNTSQVSIDEKPVSRCAENCASDNPEPLQCPSMRNPSAGAPAADNLGYRPRYVSIDEKPVSRCAARE